MTLIFKTASWKASGISSLWGSIESQPPLHYAGKEAQREGKQVFQSGWGVEPLAFSSLAFRLVSVPFSSMVFPNSIADGVVFSWKKRPLAWILFSEQELTLGWDCVTWSVSRVFVQASDFYRSYKGEVEAFGFRSPSPLCYSRRAGCLHDVPLFEDTDDEEYWDQQKPSTSKGLACLCRGCLQWMPAHTHWWQLLPWLSLRVPWI